MEPATTDPGPPEYNRTGMDYSDRRHFRYTGPLIDVHAHVTRTALTESTNNASTTPATNLEQAEAILQVAEEFKIIKTYSMCPPDDIPELRERFGARLGFNGPISKKALDEPDEVAY